MYKESYQSELPDADREFIQLAWPELVITWCANVGDYQGTNYVVGYVGDKVLACGYGYGSCSGCGAWGEGGEPTKPEDLIDSGVFGKTLDETLAWAADQPVDDYQTLNVAEREHLKLEIKRAFSLAQKGL